MHKFFILLENKFSRFLVAYEEFIGITELKLVQSNVIQTEQEFLNTQNQRRDLQSDINNIQAKRNEIISELENTARGQKRFLQLVTQEHEIIVQETEMRAALERIEDEERSAFSQLSSRLRESHEKERAQREKTKHWGVAGSVIGALLGVAGASVTGYLRHRELGSLLRELRIERQTVVGNAVGGVSEENLTSTVRNIRQEEHGPCLEAAAVTHQSLERLQEQVSDLQQAVATAHSSLDVEATPQDSLTDLRRIVLCSTSAICVTVALSSLLLVVLSPSPDMAF